MAPSGGLEVLLVNRDRQFGPLVTFGLGGIYVEVLKDVTFPHPAIFGTTSPETLEEIRARALLGMGAWYWLLIRRYWWKSLLRIGQLVQDFPEITELDINPLR